MAREHLVAVVGDEEDLLDAHAVFDKCLYLALGSFLN
jgi:hypothetical protein